MNRPRGAYSEDDLRGGRTTASDWWGSGAPRAATPTAADAGSASPGRNAPTTTTTTSSDDAPVSTPTEASPPGKASPRAGTGWWGASAPSADRSGSGSRPSDSRAADGVLPPPPPPVERATPPLEPKAPKSQKRRRLLAPVGLAVGVLALLAAGGAAFAVARPFDHAVVAATSAARPSPAAAARDSSAPVVPTPTPTPTREVAFAAPLSQQGRRALLLSASDLDAVGLATNSAATTSYTPAGYAKLYTKQSVSPADCDTLKGLMVFTDQSSANSSASKTIDRTDDLVLAGSAEAGSQQIRQFATAEDAIAFMEAQKSWFASCSQSTFTSGSTSVGFDGAVFLDSTPDALLTTSDDSGARWQSEFNGWVRNGTVVYAAYLLADADTNTAELKSTGTALMKAALTKLRAAG